MRAILKNTLVVFLALVPPVFVDYLYIRSGQSHDSTWYSMGVGVASYALAPLGFYWANSTLFCNQAKPWRYFYPAAMAVSLSVIWYFVIAIAVIINLHLAFGGHL